MRAEKQLLLDEMKEAIDNSGAFLITQYQGLSANSSVGLRDSIAEKGGEMKVVRKRVFLKASEAMGLSLEPSMLDGHIAVVFAGEDAVETTKTVFQFGKENPNTLDVLGGLFDGVVCDAAKVKKLSTLPGKDEMRAQLLGLFEAPMSQTLSVMESLLTSVIFCLDNKVKQEQDNEKS
jgi:large subunit ribosomal protein L10